MHVKKGDKVMVISGKDKGKTGVILDSITLRKTVCLLKVSTLLKNTLNLLKLIRKAESSAKKHLFMFLTLCCLILRSNEPTRVGYKDR